MRTPLAAALAALLLATAAPPAQAADTRALTGNPYLASLAHLSAVPLPAADLHDGPCPNGDAFTIACAEQDGTVYIPTNHPAGTIRFLLYHELGHLFAD